MAGSWLLLALPPLAVLGLVAFNIRVWPRGRADGPRAERVSVLIPARNEAGTIERCVRAALAGGPHEVVVYDDGSTDGTTEILSRIAAEEPRLLVVSGAPLPPGWVGKPHACHHLAEAATGEWLLFLDADTIVRPEYPQHLGSLARRYQADVVTLGVRHRLGSAAEKLVVPLLHLTYLAWLPLPLVWRSGDPRFLVANGQFLAVRRAVYQAAGGWAAVRGEVVDDMAFCRRVKESGGRVLFADGHHTAECRMYAGAGEVWRGFSKNLYEGIGGHPVALGGVLLLHLWIFLLPYAALAAALAGAPVPFAPAVVGVAANVGIRALLAWRFRQPASGILLHPLSVVALLSIAVNSFLWSRKGAIHWRGRVYGERAARVAR